MSLPPVATQPGPRHRNRGLDVLRGAAIVLVLGRHMLPRCPHDQFGSACAPFDLWLRAGWAGVDLFFVLSGFLVSGLLFREYRRTGRVRLRTFLVRRGFKIYPSFYVLFVIYAAFEITMGSVRDPMRYLHEATFVQNYLPGVWNHTWSLAVEEHFYFAIGLLLWVIAVRRWSMAAILPVGAGVLVACLALRVTLVRQGGNPSYLTHTRMDALMFGCMLSYLSVFREEAFERVLRRHGRWMASLAVAALLPLLVFEDNAAYVQTAGLTINYLAFGVIVVMVARQDDRLTGLAWRVLAVVGANSYSIYLWHMFAKRSASLVRHHDPTLSYPLEFSLYVSGALTLGFLAARFIERPSLALRDRMWPDRPAPQPAPPPAAIAVP